MPVIGICLFVLLYIVAALLYPGGSQHDEFSKGFSWLHNYWCDLLEYKAQNGADNPSRPVAIAGMAVLCISLILFWYYVPPFLTQQKKLQRTIQVAGIASMMVACFLSSAYHDVIINIAAFLGVIAITGTLVALYKAGYKKLFFPGITCIVLCALNNYIYYTSTLVKYLPVIQKITFIIFLLWFGEVAVVCRNKQQIIAQSTSERTSESTASRD